MKEKIIMFIIGALVGAIVTTGVFFVLKQNDSSSRGPSGDRPSNMQMQGGPGGNQDGGTPPELPNGEKPSGAPEQKTENNTESNTTQNTSTESNT